MPEEREKVNSKKCLQQVESLFEIIQGHLR